MAKISLLMFMLVLMCTPGTTQTIILRPVKDNTIFSENGASSNGAGPVYFVGTTGSHANLSKRRALLQFDLASIPAGSTITGVTLAITCTKAPPPGSRAPNTVELHKCLATWGEGSSSASGGAGTTASSGDATWTCRFANGTGSCNQSWTTNGGDFSTVVSSNVVVNDTGIYTFLSTPTMIADIQSWVEIPGSNFGWLLSGDEVNSFSARAFRSKEGSALATTLTVTFSPAPCTSATWTGALSTAWETPGNWNCSSIPGNITNVIINSGTVVLNSDAAIKSLTLNPQVNLTINPGKKLTVSQ